MKATVIFDVLSHWCLAAWPAYEAAVEMLGASNVRLSIAPVHNGFPPGMLPEHLRWFYTRGTRAYEMTLRPDWYENDRTTTLWANAAVVAAAALGADLPALTRAVMLAALQDGELLGRRDVAVATAARLARIEPARLSDEMERASTGRTLNEANAELASWNCAERPSWRLENANGDHVVMQGTWHRDAVVACLEALRTDEAAYAAAGLPPG